MSTKMPSNEWQLEVAIVCDISLRNSLRKSDTYAVWALQYSSGVTFIPAIAPKTTGNHDKSKRKDRWVTPKAVASHRTGNYRQASSRTDNAEELNFSTTNFIRV